MQSKVWSESGTAKSPVFAAGKNGPKKEPKFSSVKWAKSSCEEWEEIELTANVQDITDGNMVTLQNE